MPQNNKKFFQNTIALVYDFDGTLSPKSMQDYTVLPQFGVDGPTFWPRVDAETRATGSEPMLVYMRMMIEEAQRNGRHLTRADLAALAHVIEYFPGVEQWFDMINRYVARQGGGRVGIRHYIISAGNKEILDRISIARHFARIYASEYHFDGDGRAVFPKVVVTDTTKTQFLFRINKEREELHEEINSHMAGRDRPVPFSNILYIGDGASDVPGMVVTRSNGGRAVAVYNPEKPDAVEKCKTLLQAGRVDTLAEADYREDGELAKRVRMLLDAMIVNIRLEEELFHCREEYGIPDTRT